ncbi:MAG: flagellar biosynthesis protein FlhB [Alphaproteobacteria bacterium]|nr:flagellar biosynthesis protein FlhB [Alphaproteobacteria bacterium]
MAEEDADESQKTEEPSGRKLSKARGEGNVPLSQEVRLWLSLLGTLMMVGMFATPLSRDLFPVLRHFIEHAHSIDTGEEALRSMAAGLLLQIGLMLAIPFLTLIALGFLGTMGQIGWLMVSKRIKPSLSKLSPLAGAKRLFSFMMLLDFGKSLIKLLLVGWLFWTLLVPKRAILHQLPDLSPLEVMLLIQDMVLELVFWVLLLYAFVAAADFFYQRYNHNKQLRMTKQEVKEEGKDTEGDQTVKSKQKSIRMQRARQRMLMAVPKATVIITNPTHYAVALHYEMETMQAPVLVAKGIDFLAKKIREIGEENAVPIVENPPLARALYATVELDQSVPPEHYKAVAEVIGYVFKLKKKI